MSNLSFRMMAAEFKLRDWLRPREVILEEAGLQPGFRVLDFGCGPGSYIEPAARRVGASGEVLALDIQPLAIQIVRRLAERKGYPQVRTILSDGPTGLPDQSMDIVLLYDILHDLEPADDVLRELHRVLKPGGALSVNDHHLKPADITARATAAGLFRLDRRGRHTLRFTKNEDA